MLADASPQALQQQLHTFVQSLDISEPASLADDRKYREFISGEPHQSVSGSEWAEEFQQQHPSIPSHRPAAHTPSTRPAPDIDVCAAVTPASPHNAWAESFQQHPHAQHWASEFSAHQHLEHHHQRQHHTGPPKAEAHHPLQSWVSEYQAVQQPAADQPWVKQYLSEPKDGTWASEFVEQQNQHGQPDKLTPEELKRLKGPQADDPLDDKTALSWVRQFNETADQPSVNFNRGISLKSAIATSPPCLNARICMTGYGSLQPCNYTAIHH